MKIAIYTVTMNRLEYTKHCFKTLQGKAGVEYDHYIVDNGSNDGTVEELKAWIDHLKDITRPKYFDGKVTAIFNEKNLGIGKACNQALDMIGNDYDLIIKFDNDCEVVSDNILKQIVEVYKGIKKYAPRYILSPRVGGIVNQPNRHRYNMLAGRRIGLTAMVGGLFLITDGNLNYRFNEENRRKGNDTQICDWFKKNGGEVGYIEGLRVNHYKGTNQQAIDYPEYFKLKKDEEKNEKVVK